MGWRALSVARKELATLSHNVSMLWLGLITHSGKVPSPRAPFEYRTQLSQVFLIMKGRNFCHKRRITSRSKK